MGGGEAVGGCWEAVGGVEGEDGTGCACGALWAGAGGDNGRRAGAGQEDEALGRKTKSHIAGTHADPGKVYAMLGGDTVKL